MTEATSSRSNPGKLLLDGLEKAWRTYRSELKRCRDEFSNEAIHDLRVAARRLVAILRLLHSIAPRPRLQKTIRILKEQLDEFDDLRDTQVILAEISETIQQFPELQAFQKRQLREEDKLLRNVRRQVKKFNIKELSRRVRKIHDSMQTESADNLESEILQAVDDAYLITQQRLAAVDLIRPATIHRLRIAFKTFRYMVEIICPLVADFPEINLKSMHDYQARMGEVQDAEVFRQTLHDFSEKSSASDLEAIHSYYVSHHMEAVAVFADTMNQLHNFWRPAPDQPFPWEKPK
jgi:CHAD domain-containing protein